MFLFPKLNLSAVNRGPSDAVCHRVWIHRGDYQTWDRWAGGFSFGNKWLFLDPGWSRVGMFYSRQWGCFVAVPKKGKRL